MALFTTLNESFLEARLTVENGMPNHGIFGGSLRSLDPDQFGSPFARFLTSFSKVYEGEAIVDGGVMRQSPDRVGGRSPLHVMSARG